MNFLYKMASMDKWSGMHFCSSRDVRELEAQLAIAIEALERIDAKDLYITQIDRLVDETLAKIRGSV